MCGYKRTSKKAFKAKSVQCFLQKMSLNNKKLLWKREKSLNDLPDKKVIKSLSLKIKISKVKMTLLSLVTKLKDIIQTITQ